MEGERILLRLAPVPALEDLLQRREIGIAPGVIGDDFAVDEAGRQVERGDRFDQRAELVGPILAAAGEDPHLVTPGGDQCAVPVELYLVHPPVPGGNLVDQGGELGLGELGKRGRLSLAAWLGGAGIAGGGLFHLCEEGFVLLSGERVFPLLVGRDLGHRATGQHAGQLALDQHVARLGMPVL